MDHQQVALQASLEKWVPDHAGRQYLDRTAEPTGCFLNESKVAISHMSRGRILKFSKEINITIPFPLSPRYRAKKPQPFDTVTAAKVSTTCVNLFFKHRRHIWDSEKSSAHLSS